MVHQHQQTQQLCPMALKPMMPCQQQHEHQIFASNQPTQFMSPQHQYQPPFMSQSNGPPLEGGMAGQYRPWPPSQLPPMHGREQGAFPPAMSPLLPTVFSPGGGPPGRGDHLQQHPGMSMDNLCMFSVYYYVISTHTHKQAQVLHIHTFVHFSSRTTSTATSIFTTEPTKPGSVLTIPYHYVYNFLMF